MVVVDSSALIPLAWIARLDLVSTAFDDVHTTEDVRDEVLAEAKRGTAALDEFLAAATIHERPDRAEAVASMEGLAVADASVILRAGTNEAIILANDKGLIEVARSHGIECWWVTTVFFGCAKDEVVTAEEAVDFLYDLMDEGMNLHPRVYTQVQKKLRELGK